MLKFVDIIYVNSIYMAMLADYFGKEVIRVIHIYTHLRSFVRSFLSAPHVSIIRPVSFFNGLHIFRDAVNVKSIFLQDLRREGDRVKVFTPDAAIELSIQWVAMGASYKAPLFKSIFRVNSQHFHDSSFVFYAKPFTPYTAIISNH